MLRMLHIVNTLSARCSACSVGIEIFQDLVENLKFSSSEQQTEKNEIIYKTVFFLYLQ